MWFLTSADKLKKGRTLSWDSVFFAGFFWRFWWEGSNSGTHALLVLWSVKDRTPPDECLWKTAPSMGTDLPEVVSTNETCDDYIASGHLQELSSIVSLCCFSQRTLLSMLWMIKAQVRVPCSPTGVPNGFPRPWKTHTTALPPEIV